MKAVGSTLHVPLIMWASLVAVSCMRSEYFFHEFAPGSDDGVPLPTSLDVLPVYPSHAAWNDYIKNDDSTQDVFHQDDVACDGTETGGPTACLHGGELRKVLVPDSPSCAGLALRDTLDVFAWVCDSATSPVTFYSGLKPSGGLRQLVTASGWRTNRVILSNSQTDVAASEDEAWWSNPVVPLSDNSAQPPLQLGQAGTIYTLATTRATRGYNLGADRVGVVTLAGATLTYAGGLSCMSGTGEVGSNSGCVLAAGSQKFLWIEADLDGLNSAALGLLLFAVNFSQIRSTAVTNNFDAGIRLTGCASNTLRDVESRDNGTDGVNLRNAQFNLLANIQASGNGDTGLFLEGSPGTSDDNHAYGVMAADNEQRGVRLYFANRNILAGVTVANTGGPGVDISDAIDNTLVNVISHNNANTGVTLSTGTIGHTFFRLTVANNGSDGIKLSPALNSVVAQLVAANNGSSGLLVESGSSGNVISQVATANNSNADVRVLDSDNNRFTDNVLVATCTTSCASACVNPGFEPCAAVPGPSTDANVVTISSLAGAFAGKVTVDDARNASDAGGSGDAASIIDWLSFDNSFRGWGLDAPAAFPDPSQQGRCISGTCRIWDWRLKNSDLVILNRSGDGWNDNPAFPDGGACPAGLSTNTLTDMQGAPNTFLVNATEITADTTGDNDGLCETGEDCLWLPNFGAYQGEGDYQSRSCDLAGFTMHAFATNGTN